ncbi:MAG: glycoside hydrolase family 3 protein [Anaerolineae bacterium]
MNITPKNSVSYLLIVLTVAIGTLGTACSTSGTDTPPPPTLAVPSPQATVAATTALEAPLYRDPTAPIDDRVAALLSRMSLDEKIGQMTLAERDALNDIQDIAAYYLGALLSGGGSIPSPNTPESWADMYDSYQGQALSTRLGIPLIYGADAVHGHNNVKGAVIFPHNIGLGATRNPELVEEIGHITALEVAGTGVDWTFSPCLAVFRDERWGRAYESFGETPELVSLLGGAIVRGYQGADLGSGETILATAKHWVGDGGTTGGVDRANTEVDEQTLREIHIAPYVEAINAGVGSIMVSQSSWNGVEMHANGYLINDVLKGELGFGGFVVSDWEAIDQIPGDYRSDVRTAINAGLDMIMVPYEYVTFIDTLREAVGSGDVPMERIDDAVSRILRIKFQLGLFENPYADRSLTGLIGSAEHREVARQAVRESLVLLKNEGAILPLPKDLSHVHVAGRNADDLGSQCGGWTITWQGGNGNITTGTTILEAIENTVSENTSVTFSRDGSGAEGADVGIVVLGETPYAEWEGDSNDLSLSQADVNAINAVREAGVPVVVILVSGRPMIVEPELENWDALIAAWLPGTEGQGVADVLFGDYNPTGKLPCSWPRTMEQIPINYGDADYDPLFAYGFGLEYE